MATRTRMCEKFKNAVMFMFKRSVDSSFNDEIFNNVLTEQLCPNACIDFKAECFDYNPIDL